ncbi:MAG: ribosome maturation factor RimM [Gammaproteobacteria bacterium]|uniref:ribosome maturation factor RimM n=1 Tax=Marinobacter nitratireducens TaxID=1137280 RepID=UPI000564B6A2|nr:ribosome maturation factor RimM [Marinobacter nitratireducens]TNE73210.1 MAG: ribosome maturation factor RimM [Gammaproteobacteria bacterium]TNE97589.1 MAG: ribosome maturation factor RimM [Gammaproteobacteria bacterium]
MTQHSQETVIGQITSVFGVKGWLKVFSYTDPKEGILQYRDWVLDLDGKRIPARLEEGRRQGQGIVVRLKGVDDRDVALSYRGADIKVATAELPELAEGEYYWYQLEGLDVFTVDGQCLGKVHHLMETGSNDVLVVRASDGSIDQRERLLPYLPDQVVRSVDLAERRILVEWDPEF